MKRVGAAPRMRTTPATEPSAPIRPEPTEPSKQVNENCLLATKRRAESAFKVSANDGVAAATTDSTTARRNAMSDLLPVNHAQPAQYAGRLSPNPERVYWILTTIRPRMRPSRIA